MRDPLHGAGNVHDQSRGLPPGADRWSDRDRSLCTNVKEVEPRSGTVRDGDAILPVFDAGDRELLHRERERIPIAVEPGLPGQIESGPRKTLKFDTSPELSGMSKHLPISYG